MEKKQTVILDEPPAGKDSLDVDPYELALADINTSPQMCTPLTIGGFGEWGSGKTTLML